MTPKGPHVHLFFGTDEPNDALKKTISDIVFIVKHKVAMALRDEQIGLREINPLITIATVVTNILVRLLEPGMSLGNSVADRLTIVKEILNEITDMTMAFWKVLEAEEANDTVAH